MHGKTLKRGIFEQRVSVFVSLCDLSSKAEVVTEVQKSLIRVIEIVSTKQKMADIVSAVQMQVTSVHKGPFGPRCSLFEDSSKHMTIEAEHMLHHTDFETNAPNKSDIDNKVKCSPICYTIVSPS